MNASDIDVRNLPEVDRMRLKKLLEEKSRLRKHYGMAFYEPHKKQHMFHAAGAKKRRYVRTGNRFGKSMMGAAEDCAWAYGERLWYPEGDERRLVGLPLRSTKGLILVSDWDKAEEIFTKDIDGEGRGKLLELLPVDSVVRKIKNNAGVIGEIHVKCRWGGVSVILLDTIKSFKSNAMGQESSDWDWIHVDEPIPKEMWTANSRGLMDRDGSAWFTCTPINEGWINEMFLPGRQARMEQNKPFEKNKDFWMISGSSYDNPYLSKSALEIFEAELSKEEVECRLHGIPLALSGLVYKQFNHEEHIYEGTPYGWEAPNKPPKHYTIRVSIDPHPRTPHAVLFAATAPDGTVYVFAEIFRHEIIESLSEGINALTEGRWVLSYLCDPSAFIPHPIDNSSMADAFLANGIPVEKAPKDLQRGILATQAKLAERQKTPDGKTIPTIFFSEELAETIYEFDRYSWDSKRPNKPIDREDHMMECLYRLVITGLEYVDETETDTFHPSPAEKKFNYVPKYL